MAITRITYSNKVDLNENTSIANINKVMASDMNEIKSVVNNNATNIGDMDNLVGGADLVSAIASLDTALGEIVSVESDSTRKSIKFSNGIMINTLRQGYTATCNTDWGGIYASSTITTNNFLTSFDNGPITCTASVGISSGNHWFMWVDGLASSTKAPNFQLLRGSSGTANGILYVIAIGTWR